MSNWKQTSYSDKTFGGELYDYFRCNATNMYFCVNQYILLVQNEVIVHSCGNTGNRLRGWPSVSQAISNSKKAFFSLMSNVTLNCGL